MSSAARSDIVDIAVQVHARTQKAVLVSDDGDAKNAKWLPLSQIEIELDQKSGAQRGRATFATISLPHWLAADKGFV